MNRVDVAAAGIAVPAWKKEVRAFAAAVLRELAIEDWELSIVLCDDPFIAELNARYRGVQGPTDVLSFSQEDQPGGPAPGQTHPAGDVVVSLATLRRNAARYGQPAETELKRLLIHGILHLRGLDHPPAGDGEMLELQERVLQRVQEKRIGI